MVMQFVFSTQIYVGNKQSHLAAGRIALPVLLRLGGSLDELVDGTLDDLLAHPG